MKSSTDSKLVGYIELGRLDANKVVQGNHENHSDGNGEISKNSSHPSWKVVRMSKMLFVNTKKRKLT